MSSTEEKYQIDETFRVQVKQLDPPPRLLLGPGPCNAHPRVTAALGFPQVGHMDPYFMTVMEESQTLLKYAFQTQNRITIPVSGTGSAAMEATFANLVEPGDVVLIGINGYFGQRMVDMAERYGASVRSITTRWGTNFSLQQISEAMEQHQPKILCLVHAETSTGCRQPIEGVSDVCRKHGALLLVDTVTSLSGVPLFLDKWGIDACYSGTQKCLSCPPGLGPLSMSERAMEKLLSRKSKVPNWYLDLSMVAKYWGKERTYHHTAPISMNYAFREALRIVAEEGLEARWARHQRVAEELWQGLEKMGLECLVEKQYRLPSLTTVRVPEGVDAKAVQSYLLTHFNIEVGGAFGELAGKVWRIGLMGHNARSENVQLVLTALQKALDALGHSKAKL